MNKAKRHVNHFINHLFAIYHVPRIPVHIHWHHPSLVDSQGNYGFGVLSLLDPAHPCIHIAAKALGKTGVMQVFAHEFVHYLQFLHGRDMSSPQIEVDAEFWESQIMNGWECHRKLAIQDFPLCIQEPVSWCDPFDL